MSLSEFEAIKAAVIKDGRTIVKMGERLCACGGISTCRVCLGNGRFKYAIAKRVGDSDSPVWAYILQGERVGIWYGTRYLHSYFIGDIQSHHIGPFADLEVIR